MGWDGMRRDSLRYPTIKPSIEPIKPTGRSSACLCFSSLFFSFLFPITVFFFSFLLFSLLHHRSFIVIIVFE